MNNYNNLAESYDSYGKEATTDWILGYLGVIDFLTPLNEKVVLDYGCGTGKFCRYISEQGAKVIGVDTSEKMIQLGEKNKSENIEYRKVESGELDFINSYSVDFAVLNFVTCTISSKVEVVKILKEINRALEKGGILVILNLNWEKSNGKEFISCILDYVPRLKSGNKVGVTLKSLTPLAIEDYFWSKNDYLEMLKDANFKIKSIQEPLAEDNSQKWINEDKYPPFLIIVSEKKNI